MMHKNLDASSNEKGTTQRSFENTTAFSINNGDLSFQGHLRLDSFMKPLQAILSFLTKNLDKVIVVRTGW
jgi:hypothetical protein